MIQVITSDNQCFILDDDVASQCGMLADFATGTCYDIPNEQQNLNHVIPPFRTGYSRTYSAHQCRFPSF